MDKQITDTQAFALSFTPFRYKARKTDSGGRTVYNKEGKIVYEIVGTTRFIKAGEAQSDALKRLRSSTLGRTKQKTNTRRYPVFMPGMTTSNYVATFESINNLRTTRDADHLTNPAPMLDPAYPEVEITVDTFEDLI